MRTRLCHCTIMSFRYAVSCRLDDPLTVWRTFIWAGMLITKVIRCPSNISGTEKDKLLNNNSRMDKNLDTLNRSVLVYGHGHRLFLFRFLFIKMLVTIYAVRKALRKSVGEVTLTHTDTKQCLCFFPLDCIICRVPWMHWKIVRILLQTALCLFGCLYCCCRVCCFVFVSFANKIL